MKLKYRKNFITRSRCNGTVDSVRCAHCWLANSPANYFGAEFIFRNIKQMDYKSYIIRSDAPLQNP